MSNVGNYAKDPADVLKANLDKGYVGVRIEQGVPLLERDLNLQSELLAAVQRSIIERYIGNGSRYDTVAFQVAACDPPEENNFQVRPGSALVGGFEVSGGINSYKAQQQPPAPNDPILPIETVKPGDGPRVDTVYLDVWLDEVAVYPNTIEINNDLDINRRTSVRTAPRWCVRVTKPNEAIPAAPFGHAFYQLAEIKRTTPKITNDQIVDKRVKNLGLSDLVQKVNQLQSDIAKLKDALKPQFAFFRQFDRHQGYAERVVTLYGRNFHLGNVTVSVKSGDDFLPTGMQIVSDILPNSITVRIPQQVTPGNAQFTVHTTFGNAVSTQLFRIFHKVVWSASPWPPGDKHPNVFYQAAGQFFDCPGLEIQAKRDIDPGWSPVDHVTPTAQSVQVKMPSSGAGNYQFRARNEAAKALYPNDEASQWSVWSGELAVLGVS